jgi:ribosome-associated protein
MLCKSLRALDFKKGNEVMHQIILREDYIKLGQALKAAGLVDTGVDAKMDIKDGKVKVNGVVELQRGKKLYDGSIVDYNGEQIQVVK